MADPIIISASPHIHSARTSEKVMYDVLYALIPAFLVSIYVFEYNTRNNSNRCEY